MLTGIKDLDYAILNKLGDRDLISVCQVNKTASKLCDDETFWFNRILSRFPEVPPEIFVKNKNGHTWLEYYGRIKNKNGRSWSEYYIKDLRKINTKKPNELLLEGSKRGREDWVMIALNKGADVHYVGGFGPALQYASAAGHLDVVKILLGTGADVHAGNGGALTWASRYGDIEVIEILLKAGADIHANNDSALSGVSAYGHSDIVQILLKAGANVHARDGTGADAPLRRASGNGYIEVVKILLEAGADVHAENDKALIDARKRGHPEVVKLLEEYMYFY